jgi:hypothetical protein
MGGSGVWSLPKEDQPGEWMPPIPPTICLQGYHVCEEKDLIKWLAFELFEVEIRGEKIVGDSKICAEQARLIRHPWMECCIRKAWGRA